MTVVTIADRVRAVLAEAPVIDGHNDLAWALRHRVGYDFDQLDIAVDQSATGLHTDLPRLTLLGRGLGAGEACRYLLEHGKSHNRGHPHPYE